MPPPYLSIDHVMLRLTAAEPFFDLFSRVFGLPVAWPLQQSAFATYGWVHAGNTDLEFWAASSNGDLPDHAQPPLIHGFALEPALPLPQVLERTAAAGIASKAARVFQSSNAHGEVVTNFTNAVVLDVSAPSCCIFFCEWNSRAAIYPWEDAVTPAQRRALHRQALQDAHGGPLGLIGLQSVRMGTPDLEKHRRQWQVLSGSPPGLSIMLAPGITLDLVPAGQLLIESITFSVHSLATARRFLASRQLLQEDTGDTLWIACDGLRIGLTEIASVPA